MNIHHTLLLTVLLGITSSLNAQKITARVVDVKGEGIPYATVYVPQSNIGTLTSPDGKFTLPAAEIPDSATVTVSSIGYKNTDLTAGSLRKTSLATVTLLAKDYQLATVEVIEKKSRMRKGKLSLPGFLNATYSFPPGQDFAIYETGTILKTKRKCRLEALEVKFRELSVDSILIDMNVYDMKGRRPGASLLKERLFLTVKSDDVGKKLNVSLAGQNIWANKKLLVSLRILEAWGSETSRVSLAGKAANGFGFSRRPNGQWETSYFVPATSALVSYPK